MSVAKFAVGYLRCSTDRQEDSPDQQRKDIELFAQREGYTLVEWFVDDGQSGTTFDERAAFQSLRQRVENHPTFEAVICYDESRWGRAIDAEENTYWRVYFRKRGVDVLLVKSVIDPKHEYAPMMQAFEGVQASQYSKKLSELTLRGAKNNKVFSNGGTAPYGYDRVAVNSKTGAERTLSHGEWCNRDQEKVKWALGSVSEQEIVQLIFQDRVSGNACVVIAESLNNKKVPCPKRGRWRNSDQKWSATTVRSIIENPVYYGARIYNRNSMSKIQAQHRGDQTKQGVRYPHWRNNPSEWIVVEDAHESIVSKELWNKSNAVNRQQKGTRGNRSTYMSQYLLTGLLRCKKCGFPFQGWSGKAKGKIYRKYIDSGWQNKRVCEFHGIPQEPLERVALEAIKRIISQPITTEKLEEQIRSYLDSRPADIVKKAEEVTLALATKEDALKNLTAAIERGLSIESVLDRVKVLENERAGLCEEMRTIKAEMETQLSVVDTAQEVQEFMSNFDRIFEQASMAEKKFLVKLCISEIVVDKDQNTIDFFVRKIPAVSPQLKGLYENKRALTEVVSARSSGGRT